MARINLSVPDELKERMDKLERVNWSEVAQDAFTVRAGIEEQRMGGNLEVAGISRLRADRDRQTVGMKMRGIEAGRRWALEAAKFEELDRLISACEYAEKNKQDLPNVESVYFFISDNHRASSKNVRDFWHKDIDISSPTPDFVAGFLEGARAIHGMV